MTKSDVKAVKAMIGKIKKEMIANLKELEAHMGQSMKLLNGKIKIAKTKLV